MNYQSTRSNHTTSPSQAILNGLAPDGGLYVPKKIIKLPLKTVVGQSYQQLAYTILKLYFPDIDTEDLLIASQKAYNTDVFKHPQITNLRHLTPKRTLLELFYGPTLAFKDYALAIYPYLVKAAMRNLHLDQLSIITATSGDTGKAAMEAIKDVSGLKIAVLYPTHGTSTIQALQMKTQTGNNVLPLAINGSFDDAQHAVKSFLTKYQNQAISSANSINIARLIPQIIYYYDAFLRLPADTLVDVFVPTGNFGNALAAYLAKAMGLPINKICLCTNENNVLHDFITKGIYDLRHRHLTKTHAPSMDILIASNLERLLFLLLNDANRVAYLMTNLQKEHYFTLSSEESALVRETFISQTSSNQCIETTIKQVFQQYHYLIDPHTATALPQYTTNNPCLIVSTASPYKFPDVYRFCWNLSNLSDFEVLNNIEKISNQPQPDAIKALATLPLRHQRIIQPECVQQQLLAFIKGGLL